MKQQDLLNKTPAENRNTFRQLLYAFQVAVFAAALLGVFSLVLFAWGLRLKAENQVLKGKIINDSISINSYKQNQYANGN